MDKIFQSILNSVYQKFSKSSAGMLIATGAIGWALSSMAQIGAIVFNNKISDKEKSFLIPQETSDAIVNIGSFIAITLSAKKIVSKMFSTGKLTSPKVKAFLNNNKELYKNKIGKLDFDISKEIEKNTELQNEYNSYNNCATTLATVAGGILASNIVTPVLRNRTAASVQQSYLAEQKNKTQLNTYPKLLNYSNDMKI